MISSSMIEKEAVLNNLYFMLSYIIFSSTLKDKIIHSSFHSWLQDKMDSFGPFRTEFLNCCLLQQHENQKKTVELARIFSFTLSDNITNNKVKCLHTLDNTKRHLFYVLDRKIKILFSHSMDR